MALAMQACMLPSFVSLMLWTVQANTQQRACCVTHDLPQVDCPAVAACIEADDQYVIVTEQTAVCALSIPSDVVQSPITT